MLFRRRGATHHFPVFTDASARDYPIMDDFPRSRKPEYLTSSVSFPSTHGDVARQPLFLSVMVNMADHPSAVLNVVVLGAVFRRAVRVVITYSF